MRATNRYIISRIAICIFGKLKNFLKVVLISKSFLEKFSVLFFENSSNIIVMVKIIFFADEGILNFSFEAILVM